MSGDFCALNDDDPAIMPFNAPLSEMLPVTETGRIMRADVVVAGGAGTGMTPPVDAAAGR